MEGDIVLAMDVVMQGRAAAVPEVFKVPVIIAGCLSRGRQIAQDGLHPYIDFLILIALNGYINPPVNIPCYSPVHKSLIQIAQGHAQSVGAPALGLLHPLAEGLLIL